MKNSLNGPIRTLSGLYEFLEWKLDDPRLEEVANTFSVYMPRRLAEKIKVQGPQGPLAKEFVPALAEIDPSLNRLGLADPIGDKPFNRAPQLVHRYPSRVLFTPTSICPVHCRYCFRKNELSPKDELFQGEFAQTLQYLKDHPEITEVIFTGGDPLTLSNEKLRYYLEAFAQIPSVLDVRLHSRWPVIQPERIDQELLNLLSDAAEKFRTVSLAIHVNHVSEFDAETDAAISKLTSLPIQLLSQSVLLKGVNDSEQDLLDLFNHLIKLKVRPYYLHHPDRVKGGMHFYMGLEAGRRLFGSLRRSLPGWALPHYVIDIPGGQGKVSAFNPETTKFSGQLLNLHGEPVASQEPDFFVRV